MPPIKTLDPDAISRLATLQLEADPVPVAVPTQKLLTKVGDEVVAPETGAPVDIPSSIPGGAVNAAGQLSVFDLALSGKRTVNDNVYLALEKTGGMLTGPMVQMLFAVTQEHGITARELVDYQRIAAHFAANKDPNASILHDLSKKIRAAYLDQGFLTLFAARLTDSDKYDQLPSLTPAGVHATRPDGVHEWVDKHFTKAAEAAPADASFGQKGVDKARYIMCPVLGALIHEGSLKMDADGNISLKEFNDLMINRLGITPERAAVTVSTGFIGNHLSDAGHIIEGKFNINHLAGSILDHQGHGDTGVLQGGLFHEDRFQALILNSSDGKTLCIADIAKAINDQLRRDDGLLTRTKGTPEDIFEMGALINTFGYIDAQGDRRIDFATLRDLYQHRKLPPQEVLMERKATGVLEHGATMGKITKAMVTDK